MSTSSNLMEHQNFPKKKSLKTNKEGNKMYVTETVKFTGLNIVRKLIKLSYIVLHVECIPSTKPKCFGKVLAGSLFRI